MTEKLEELIQREVQPFTENELRKIAQESSSGDLEYEYILQKIKIYYKRLSAKFYKVLICIHLTYKIDEKDKLFIMFKNMRNVVSEYINIYSNKNILTDLEIDTLIIKCCAYLNNENAFASVFYINNTLSALKNLKASFDYYYQKKFAYENFRDDDKCSLALFDTLKQMCRNEYYVRYIVDECIDDYADSIAIKTQTGATKI